jgi:hypothetical protein
LWQSPDLPRFLPVPSRGEGVDGLGGGAEGDPDAFEFFDETDEDLVRLEKILAALAATRDGLGNPPAAP